MQRRVFLELLQTFFVCLVALLVLILIGRGLQLRELFLNLDLGLQEAGMLFLYMTPTFLILVLPISCMISVFLTFLRMSTDRELTALKAGGVSVYQMLVAPACFSLLCTAVALIISLHGISWGMESFRSLLLSVAQTKARVVVQPGVFNQDVFGLTLFARKVDPETGKLEQVVFEERGRKKGAGFTILAPTGEIATDEAKGELVLTLRNGTIYSVEGKVFSITGFSLHRIGIDLTAMLTGAEVSEARPRELSWEALRTMERDKTAPSERYQRKVGVEIQKRLALPAACLVLGIFALPLACAFEGVGRQAGLALALGFFLLYYGCFSVGLSLGESGVLAAVPALWSGNLVFSLFTAWGLWLAAKEREPALGRFLRRLFTRRKPKRVPA